MKYKIIDNYLFIDDIFAGAIISAHTDKLIIITYEHNGETEVIAVSPKEIHILDI